MSLQSDPRSQPALRSTLLTRLVALLKRGQPFASFRRCRADFGTQPAYLVREGRPTEEILRGQVCDLGTVEKQRAAILVGRRRFALGTMGERCVEDDIVAARA